MSVENASESPAISYDNEWSRLLAAVGREALQRLQASNILLVGLNGLGAEIAKNIVMMGVKSLTIHDTETVSMLDLSSQFLLSESVLGRNRAEASLAGLLDLNERVKITVNEGELSEEFLSSFTVVVLADLKSRSEMLRINNFCHANNIAFIACGVFGLFGFVFNDFGPKFTCIDPNGENPKSAYIESITNGEKGVITVVDSKLHDLEDNDIIIISEVQGMEEINGLEIPVTVTGPYTLQIMDTSNFGTYIKGGHLVEVKRPKVFEFQPLSAYFDHPMAGNDVLICDYSKFDRISCGHFYVQALLAYHEQHNRFPTPGSNDDAEEVVKIANSLYQQVRAEGDAENLDESTRNWMQAAAKGSVGVISPMTCIFGGVVGQEIIKAASSKYSPLKQWFFFDSLECLPSTISEEECLPRNTRYDSQIAVFGNTFNDKILNLNYFLVGAGAIGCEVLKCWAGMGLGCGPNGKIDVTDMDTIEISNLNRQLLYRLDDVGEPKSQVASRAILKMNPHMKVEAWTVRVGPETENTYNQDFFERIDGVCNALDNVQARMYMDSRCVWAKKSLLESGTQGTKGNTQVVVPYVTESYSSSVDPPNPDTPVCLLHSFPNNIQHCLQWARELLFEGHFVQEPEVTNNFITQPGFLENLPPTSRIPTLNTLKNNILERASSLEDCIAWARCIFEDRYKCQIQQLLFTFPLDYTDQHGAPFWSGAKRPPTPIDFDIDNPLHMEFMVSATLLKAYTCGIRDTEFKPQKEEELNQIIEKIRAHSPSVTVPEFVPKQIKIETDEKVTKKVESYTDEDELVCKSIQSRLPPPESVANQKMNPVTFEKDDDKNYHIDFISAAANLRATNYQIPTVSRFDAKIIAGKIIPAIVTTTAAVVGFVNLELYKIHCGQKKIEDFRNTYVNLALPMFQQSEPIAPATKQFAETKFTLWDRIDIRLGDCTLQEVVDYFASQYKIVIDMIGVGSSLIYASWMGGKAKERLPMKVTAVVEEIMGCKLDPTQKFLMLEPTASDENGEDIEDLPQVCFWYK